MKRSVSLLVALPFVLAAVSLFAQGQHLYVIPTHVFTAEPRDPTLQLPDLGARRATVKDLRGCLFGPVNAIMGVRWVSGRSRSRRHSS